MAQTILYVEDNDDNALMIQLILKREGFTVQIAKDGETGLQLARELRPDLILLDYHLPGIIKGPDFVRTVRGTSQIADIPIIMLTADTSTYPESMQSGVDLYLNKPISREPLLNSIFSLL